LFFAYAHEQDERGSSLDAAPVVNGIGSYEIMTSPPVDPMIILRQICPC